MLLNEGIDFPPRFSLKYDAALQHAQDGPTPILLLVDTRSGHGAGKPTSRQIYEWADRFAFLSEAPGHDRSLIPQAVQKRLDSLALRGSGAVQKRLRLSEPYTFPEPLFVKKPVSDTSAVAARKSPPLPLRGTKIQYRHSP